MSSGNGGRWAEQHSPESEFEARGHRRDTPLSVAQLNWFVKHLLEQAVPKVWVEGEVSDLSQPASGHLYFTLKDEDSQVRAVIWRSTAQRLPFKLKEGQSVVCCGGVDVYPPRGTYQLTIQRIQPQGVGPLQLAFQQLHQRLAKEGLFSDQHKQPLPSLPGRIGFVTSSSGAALHDFLEAAKSRWAAFQLTLIPALVQGDNAARDLVRAIRLAHQLRPKLDVLIVGRGGGSQEDLWCFNEEPVVRAIHAARIPIVSAVGHEIDVTLSDLVADERALTPTHVASLLLPDAGELRSRLVNMRQRVDAVVRTRLATAEQRLESMARRSLLARPHELHLQRRQQVDEWEVRGRHAIWKLLANRGEQLASWARAVEALSPLSVLSRGYSLTTKADSGTPVSSIESLQVGDALETRLAQGKVQSQITRLHPE